MQSSGKKHAHGADYFSSRRVGVKKREKGKGTRGRNSVIATQDNTRSILSVSPEYSHSDVTKRVVLCHSPLTWLDRTSLLKKSESKWEMLTKEAIHSSFNT